MSAAGPTRPTPDEQGLPAATPASSGAAGGAVAEPPPAPDPAPAAETATAPPLFPRGGGDPAAVPGANASLSRQDSASPAMRQFLLDPSHPLHVPPHVAMVTLEERMRSEHRALRKDIAELRQTQEEFAGTVKRRNNRVEKEHEWNTSFVRGLVIMVCTYVCLGLYMQLVDIDRPWINAIVPTVGFWLSTLSLDKLRPIYLRIMFGPEVFDDAAELPARP
jgi:hypothetical protein